MKHAAGRSDARGRRVRISEDVEDKTLKLFRKYSREDAEMDAAEFAESLNEILGKGVQLHYTLYTFALLSVSGL